MRHNPTVSYTEATFTGSSGAGLPSVAARDSNTELMYYGARFYDPFLGRFLVADTIAPDPGNPQSLNRYSYVNGNPLRYVDSTGHSACAAEDRACWVAEFDARTEYYRSHGYEERGGRWEYPGRYVISGTSSLIGDDHRRRTMISDFARDLAANGTSAGEALARVTAYTAAFYTSVAVLTPFLVIQYVDDISHVLTGMAGIDIVADQANAREATDPYFVGQGLFPDTDLRAVFRDGTPTRPIISGSLWLSPCGTGRRWRKLATSTTNYIQVSPSVPSRTLR